MVVLKKGKKVLICGAGSIGVYIGVMLNRQGHEVQLFGRRKLRGIEKNNIIIDGVSFQVPEKIFRLKKREKYDFIFITSKLYDFDKVVRLLKKNGLKADIIAAVQNGLVDISEQSKILKKRIIPITIFSGFNLNGNNLTITPTPTGWKTEYARDGIKIAKLLKKAGIPCTADKKFDMLRAEKTVVNCCLNCLSAIEKKTFKELFRNKKTRKRIEKLFDECHNILKREHKLEEAKKMKQKMFKNWKNLNHYSSTCQDLMSKRNTEAKFFNGYTVDIAKKYEMPAWNNLKILLDMKKAGKS